MDPPSATRWWNADWKCILSSDCELWELQQCTQLRRHYIRPGKQSSTHRQLLQAWCALDETAMREHPWTDCDTESTCSVRKADTWVRIAKSKIKCWEKQFERNLHAPFNQWGHLLLKDLLKTMQSAAHTRSENRLIDLQIKIRQMLNSKDASTGDNARALVQKQLARNEKSEYQTAVLYVVLRGTSKCKR